MFKKLLTILFTVLISVSLITFNVHAESAPATPSAPKVENYVSGVRITVNKVEGASKYRIYRKEVLADGSISSYELVKTITGTTYIDKTVKSGTKYYYAVKAGNAENKYSKVSSKTPVYYLATPSIDLVYPNFGSSFYGLDKQGIGLLIFTYDHVTRVNVYRKAGSEKDYKLIKSLTVKDNDDINEQPHGGINYTFIDKNVKPDTKYAYKVEAQRGNYKSYISQAKVSYFVPYYDNFTVSSPSKGKLNVKVFDENGENKLPKGVSGYIIYYQDVDKWLDCSGCTWEYENVSTSLPSKNINVKSGVKYYVEVKYYKKVGTSVYETGIVNKHKNIQVK